jgi:methionyl aminopeptidase
MPLYTNPAEVQKIKVACRAAAAVLRDLCQKALPSVTTADLDALAAELMKKYGCRSGSLGYPPHNRGAKNYPGQICISVNDEIVHGIGSPKRVLKEGDIVSLDVVVEKDGYYGDNARTVAVGSIDSRCANLLKATEEALTLGIQQAVPGNHIGDIGYAVESHVEAAGFSVIRNMVGHAIGRSMHEFPQVPNFGTPGRGELLKAGMVLAIEPMVNMGGEESYFDVDGWTLKTQDRLPSAHFENTIIITGKGPQILTV